LGLGGHTESLLLNCPDIHVYAFDRDERALTAAAERLAPFEGRVTFIHATYDCIQSSLLELGVESVDGIIADLGISSLQLDDADRGMSFRAPGPIDMRMDQGSGETALELIARSSQDELANLIYEYGEERASRRIARCIVQAHERGELSTTLDLRRAVVRAIGPRRVGGVDPATRTFQALRIAVNGELDQLDRLLSFAGEIIAPNGVVAILSFHSLEDRRVKRALLDRTIWQRLTKKPIVASEPEQRNNPRSRSAKLRAARRLPDGVELALEETLDFETPEPPKVVQ
ncbi:MAG TPA: 16S rRNA (cytosine(1402)-N(4))-methyltransferase RsmH, partial [Polyangiaceae bacterium]